MTKPVNNVLIIGGGFSGMSAAVQLRKIGVAVDLVEIDENWRAEGAGITVSGPSLRALETIGILPQFMEHGAISNGLRAMSPDGKVELKFIPTPKVPNSNVSGNGGIMRPVLAGILAEKTRESGTDVRLGVTFTEIQQDDNGATVTFTDGTTRSYDLVIAADGVFSSVRKLVFPEMPGPHYTGQSVWRAVVPRFGLEHPSMFLHPAGKVGFTPVSDIHMYLYYTEPRPAKDRIPDDQLLPYLKNLLEKFPAPVVQQVREHLNEDCHVHCRPLEGMLIPRPWYKGRVLLIGDCVHATTPHLASGAGLGFEDAIVIAEELERGGELQDALERYQNRRWERCRLVVANSGRLGEIEQTGGAAEEHTQIMALSIAALLAPI